MGSASSSPAKTRDTSLRFPDPRPRLFDPRRLSELLGFLIGVLGLLIALSLASYHPLDVSFNTAAPSSPPPSNWIGVVGAYTADALFQVLGWVAWLMPVVLFVIAVQMLRARPWHAPWTKLTGTVMLCGSLTTLLEFVPSTPQVAGFVRGSGLAGYLLAAGLVHMFNRTGSVIVAGAVFLTSLFLVTRFSFSAAGEFLNAHFVGVLGARWAVWREARRRERLRREVERSKVAGKQPVQQRTGPPPAAVVPKGPVPDVLLKGKGVTSPATPVLTSIVTPPATAVSAEPSAANEAPPAIASPVAPPIVRNQGLDRGPEAVPLGGISASRSRAAARSAKIVGRGAQAYKLPSPTLLREPDGEQGIDEQELQERATRLVQKFAEFGVTGAVTQIHPGPVVTTFEFKPEAGIKYSRITNLVDDLCLAMKAESILIERIAGKSTVGIEVPNLHREIIHLREIVESSEFASAPTKLTISLGKDITGKVRIGDLAQMPHLLIAGSTGSGKSVAINSLIVSILYKSTPDEVKMILIDPKRLELNLYDAIPHLFTPIVTEPKQAANVLRRATVEMEERLKKLAEHGVRNIEQYNRIFEPEATLDLFGSDGELEGPLPYLVIVIDELADLMMVEPQNVEESITRLAQMARAVGIHLILATQRPSVDVITGLIKANLPSRISFRVASKVDSRTILDANGAEALLGRGDMLFMPPASARLVRLHGPLVTEKEINKVVDWWKSQSQPQYNEEFLKPFKDGKDAEAEAGDAEEDDAADLDEVYEDAVRLVVESGKASTSLLQRRLRLGYGRAARLLDLMQRDGIISAPDGAKPREVLKRPDWLAEVDEPLR
ncbi:MAG TPA: DNA translocase FtsK [Terriglobia bacterium]|nr:DNA translocase FtsK [Terriglobia bacterium]